MNSFQALTQHFGASKDNGSDITKYAVVLSDGPEHWGFFDISSEDKIARVILDLAENRGIIPKEMMKVAEGVINTTFMAKTGSIVPLYKGTENAYNNSIKYNEIDWNKFALSLEDDSREGFEYNGKTLPLDSKSNVKAASKFFEDHSSRFTGKNRVEFSTKIAEASEKYGVDLSPTVEKYAADHLNENFDELLEKRALLAREYPVVVGAIDDLKKNASRMPVSKVAEILVEIDQLPPFNTKFGQSPAMGSKHAMSLFGINIPDAYHTAYGSAPERVLEFHEKVAALPDSVLMPKFSPVFAARLRKDSEITIKRASDQTRSVLAEMVAQHDSTA